MGFGAGDRRNTLHEIENVFGLMPFFGEHRLDDLGGFGLAETAFPQKLGAIVISARDEERLSACVEWGPSGWQVSSCELVRCPVDENSYAWRELAVGGIKQGNRGIGRRKLRQHPNE